ncbi:hypothetical protein EYR40_010839 [Pleurotus pulmonarius]|nr:hypothetical protein EYR38_002133 [Pleurotus pulmonarius]KAF4586823.1 hypothetical protein EYR40_010839 [Pleurotus pulmonarius]
MAAAPPLRLNLTETFGIGYIGSVLSAILYGVTCIQTFHYFRAAGKDPLIIKSLVFVLLLLDTAHQALITELVYHYLVENFANPLELLHNIRTIAVEIIVNAVIAFLVECFLVARVWVLSGKNKIMSVVCGVLTVAHLGELSLMVSSDEPRVTLAVVVMNVVFPVKTMAYSNIITGAERLRTFGTAGLGVAVVTDVCISATLCYYLQKGRTGFRRSDDIITKLIALTITTGLLSTLFVIANLVALVAAPEKLYSLFFNFMLGKLYINALLTSYVSRSKIDTPVKPTFNRLNARAAIRNGQLTKSNVTNTLSNSFNHIANVVPAGKGDAINVVVDVGSFTKTDSSPERGHMEMMKLGTSNEER